MIYRSRSFVQGFFGYGWCSILDEKLEFQSNSDIAIYDCEKNIKITLHQKRKSQVWTADFPRLQKSYSLTRKSNAYEFRDGKKTTKTFSLKGQIQSYTVDGISIHLNYKNNSISTLQFKDKKVYFRWSLEQNFISSINFEKSKIDMDVQNGSLQSIRGAHLDLLFKYDNFFNRTEKLDHQKRTEFVIYANEYDRVQSYFDSRKCLSKFEYKKINDLRFKVMSQRKCLNSIITEKVELYADYKNDKGQIQFKQFLLNRKTEKMANKTGESNDI